MAKIVTMGEIMLRLSPEGNYRLFRQTNSTSYQVAVKQTLPSVVPTMDMNVILSANSLNMKSVKSLLMQ